MNASEEGLAYETYSYALTLKQLSTNKGINLVLRMPSGESLKLKCAIKWSFKHLPWSLFKIGLEVLDPPLEYREYVKTLQ